MAEILPIRRKILYNQSINQSQKSDPISIKLAKSLTLVLMGVQNRMIKKIRNTQTTLENKPVYQITSLHSSENKWFLD